MAVNFDYQKVLVSQVYFYRQVVDSEKKVNGEVLNRVANVVSDHDDLLKQWRPIKMSKFRANIFLIRTTSNYFGASEVSENQVFKSQFFHLSMHLTNEK